MINRTLFLGTIRMTLTSPQGLIYVATILGIGVMFAMIPGGGQIVSEGPMLKYLLVLMLGMGLISQDFMTGVVFLIFARPVRRIEYVMSRWLGMAVTAVVIWAFLLALISLIGLVREGSLPSLGLDSLSILEDVLFFVGCAAIIILISSTGSKNQGMMILVFLWIGSTLLETLFGKKYPWVVNAGAHLRDFLMPSVDLTVILNTSPLTWYPVVAYCSSVSLALLCATWLMNRKELSYAVTGSQ